MSRRRRFLPKAKGDLKRIYDFLEPINSSAAKRALQAIDRDVISLSINPDAGRPLNNPRGFRKWVVTFGSAGYVIHYRVTDKEVIIARIWHTRERRD